MTRAIICAALAAVGLASGVVGAFAQDYYYPPRGGYVQPPRYYQPSPYGYQQPQVPAYGGPGYRGGYGGGYGGGYYQRPVILGNVCLTSRGSCGTRPRPAETPCSCMIPGFGPKRGAVVAGGY
jgi:hypothetical protein